MGEFHLYLYKDHMLIVLASSWVSDEACSAKSSRKWNRFSESMHCFLGSYSRMRKVMGWRMRRKKKGTGENNTTTQKLWQTMKQ